MAGVYWGFRGENVSTSIGCFLGRWVMDGLHDRDHGSPSRSHSQLDQRSELKLETKNWRELLNKGSKWHDEMNLDRRPIFCWVLINQNIKISLMIRGLESCLGRGQTCSKNWLVCSQFTAISSSSHTRVVKETQKHKGNAGLVFDLFMAWGPNQGRYLMCGDYMGWIGMGDELSGVVVGNTIIPWFQAELLALMECAESQVFSDSYTKRDLHVLGFVLCLGIHCNTSSQTIVHCRCS